MIKFIAFLPTILLAAYLMDESDIHLRKFYVSEVTPKMAMQLFNEYAKNTSLFWGSPQRGCEARTHSFLQHLESLDLEGGKIFAHGFFQRPEFIWKHHVAPILYIDNQINVFDPLLNPKGPISLDKWKKKMGEIDRHYITSKFQIHTLFEDSELPNAEKFQKILAGTLDLKIPQRIPRKHSYYKSINTEFDNSEVKEVFSNIFKKNILGN